MRKSNCYTSTDLFDAALSLIAEKGLAGFTYRALASFRGVTLGELTAQAGKKEQLIKSLMEHSLVLQAKAHQVWRGRIGNATFARPADFAAIFAAYMRECQGVRHTETIFALEMMTDFQSTKGSSLFIKYYFSAESMFWNSIFEQWGLENTQETSGVVRAYYIGEVGYMLSLANEADYEISLSLNLKVLAQYVFSGQFAPADTSGNEILAALCNLHEVPDDSLVLEGKRLKAAHAAARTIIKRGLSGLTHRAVAEEMNVSAASISHYFNTKAELINAALLAIRVMRQEFSDIEKRGEAGAAKNEIPAIGIFLLQAIQTLILAGVHNPKIRPILMRDRLTRGKSTEDWLGRPADRVTAQVTSLIRYGVGLAHRPDADVAENPGELTVSRLTSVFGKSLAGHIDEVTS